MLDHLDFARAACVGLQRRLHPFPAYLDWRIDLAAMRQFPDTLSKIIKGSRLRLNVISKTSGISHAYLAKLVRGNINRPGKDKIASILLSLNFSIGRINEILVEYDYQPLAAPDIPGILVNNRKRKIEGATLAQYDHIYLELLISAMERIGGAKILVKNRPSGIFIPNDMYLDTEYPFEVDKTAGAFWRDLTLALVEERKSLFRRNCRKGCRFETYICKQCLDDYLKKHLDLSVEPYKGRHRENVVRYFANAIAAIRRSPYQHQTRIVERCTYFHFQIQDADGRKPKLSFPGRKIHHYNNEFEKMNLEGFTSDASAMIALFRAETEMCRRASMKALEQSYPDNLIAWLMDRFRRCGLDEDLASAVEHLLQSDGGGFY